MDNEFEQNNSLVKRRQKYFVNPKSEQKAINLLNSGYSYGYIAKIFKCSVDSVARFKRRKEKEGIRLKRFLSGERMSSKKISKREEVILSKEVKPSEEINQGKSSYTDYLKIYEKEKRKNQSRVMRIARRTIERLKKKRERMGINYNDNLEDL